MAALRLAKVDRALCLVREESDLRRDIVIMVASAMHKQLTPMELARAFDALRNQQMGPPAIARATGYSERTVRARLILLDLPDEVQDLVAHDRLTLADAEQLARDLHKAPTASTRPHTARKSSWLTASHPLAAAAKAICDHAGTRALVGSVACGQCWETVIRDDAVCDATAAAAA